MRIAAVGFVVAAAIAAAPAAGTPALRGFVVFASNRAPDLEPQIFTVAATGGPRRNVSHAPLRSNISPAVSPDGERLAYESDGTIYVSRVDGSGRRRLGRGAEPTWSPDGSRIAFTGFRGLTVVRPDGRHARLVVPETVFSPSWSHDG